MAKAGRLEYTLSGDFEGERPATATPEALEQCAKAMRKREKAKRAEAKAQKRWRRAAIDALVRVASDESKGYASVQAAEALLRELTY